MYSRCHRLSAICRLRFRVVAGVLPFIFNGSAFADVVLDWNTIALNAIRRANTSPPIAARDLAMLHIAIYDAVNGIRKTHTPYAVPATGPTGASAVVAAAAAARRIMLALYPDAQAEINSAYEYSLHGQLEGTARMKSIEWGEHVGEQIVQLRTADGASAIGTFFGDTQPGQWRPTISFGGIVRPALLPQWGRVTPFTLDNGAQFRPPPPPSLASAEYADSVNTVKVIGGTVSAFRTREQTEIALFWAYGPGTTTPPGHWNQIAQGVVRRAERRENDRTVAEHARLFALLNIALADAGIVSWDCKYTMNFWRPITAIQEADKDGNPATTADPSWTPLLPTPPFPEYTSGHSTFSGAAAVVLTAFFGRDRISLTVQSDDLPGIRRSYQSFSEAALESGISRIYGGIHFPFANRHGLSTGAAVGTYVAWNLLTAIQSRLRDAPASLPLPTSGPRVPPTGDEQLANWIGAHVLGKRSWLMLRTPAITALTMTRNSP